MLKFNPRRTKNLKAINRGLSLFFHEKKANTPPSVRDAKELLIVDPTAIGDLVMLTPFLRALRQNAPQARITLVCGGWGKPLLQDQGLVDAFIIVDSGILNSPKALMLKWGAIRAVLREVNQTRYDLAMEPRGDLRYIFFMHFCNAARKVSYNYTGGECFLTDVIRPSERVKHLVEDKLYFASQLGCAIDEAERYPRLALTAQQRESNEAFLREKQLCGRRVFGVHPGASLAFKRWDGFAELVKRLHGEFSDAAFLIFEGPGEEKEVERVAGAATACGADFFISRTSISEYMQRLALCGAVICNDSGAGHIAAAYGVPVYVVFGPFLPETSRPYEKENVHVFSYDLLACKPCMNTVCTQNGECLKNITTDMVFETIKHTF